MKALILTTVALIALSVILIIHVRDTSKPRYEYHLIINSDTSVSIYDENDRLVTVCPLDSITSSIIKDNL